MHSIGHKGVSMLLYSPVLAMLIYFEMYILAFVGFLVVVSTSMLPDFDIGNSLISHRGFTHTIFFALLVGVGVMILSGSVVFYFDLHNHISNIWIYVFAVAGLYMYGVVCHICGDLITPSGLKPLSPVSNRRMNGRINSNSFWFNWIFYFLGLFSIVGVLILMFFYF